MQTRERGLYHTPTSCRQTKRGQEVSSSNNTHLSISFSFFFNAVGSSKRKGLEKALHQIEQAIKRPKTDVSGPDTADKVISSLQALLDMAQGQSLQSDADYLSDDPGRRRVPSSLPESSTEDNLALDDAENPLQLLARASDLQLSPPGSRIGAANLPMHPASSSSKALQNHPLSSDPGARSFFAPARASLDVGPDLDPVDVGLVTLDEADSLFSL